jgi:hypothetical protein
VGHTSVIGLGGNVSGPVLPSYYHNCHSMQSIHSRAREFNIQHAVNIPNQVAILAVNIEPLSMRKRAF